MMVNTSREYATWRWNQIVSSSGNHRILGLKHFKIFRHIGNNIRAASNDKTNAEPLDIHTEYCNALRAANLGSEAWIYLKISSAGR